MGKELRRELFQMLVNTRRRREINLGQLAVEKYSDPKVIFYGEIPEKRSDIHVLIETDEFDGGGMSLPEHLESMEETLSNSLSVRLIDDYEELTIDQLRVIDHFYGVMVQHAAGKKVPEDKLMLNIGLLTVETELPVLETTQFIGRDVLVNLGKMVDQLFRTNPVQQLKNKIDAFDVGARLLIPCPNLHIINREMGEGIHPFHNFDMKFGGLTGWYRLQCAIKQLCPNFTLNLETLGGGVEEQCKEALRKPLDDFEAAVYTFRRVLEPEQKNRIGELIADTRRIYEL
jgi:hypothetical protein